MSPSWNRFVTLMAVLLSALSVVVLTSVLIAYSMRGQVTMERCEERGGVYDGLPMRCRMW
jgi:hypothetical protein